MWGEAVYTSSLESPFPSRSCLYNSGLSGALVHDLTLRNTPINILSERPLIAKRLGGNRGEAAASAGTRAWGCVETGVAWVVWVAIESRRRAGGVLRVKKRMRLMSGVGVQ